MAKNLTVRELVIQILKNEPALSNEDVAAKVRAQLNSNTTGKNVSWYKWAAAGEATKKSDIVIEPSEDDLETVYGYGETANDEEEVEYWTEAQKIAIDYEMSKGASVIATFAEKESPGYDIKSSYPSGEIRLIEVKSKKKGKLTWVNFTANETNTLLNNSEFWLYIIEGDISRGKASIVEVPREKLLKAAKVKLHARVSNLGGYDRIEYKL